MALTQVSTNGVKDGSLLNADINASAAIAGTKIDPNFKSTGSNIDEISLTHSGNTVKIASLGQISSHGSLALRTNSGALSVRLSATTESSYINSGANFGIGTTSPSDKLTISSGNLAFIGGTNDVQYIKFGDSGDDDIGNIFYYHGNNNMVFTTNASEAMRIDSSGQVGMGTSNPVQQAGRGLHINGTDQARLKLTNASSGATANDGFDIILENGLDMHLINHENGDLKFGTNDAERMRLTGDGPHLLLGGTSDVNEITETSANAGMVIGGTGFGNAGLAIITSTSGTGRLYFGDNTGNNAGRNRGQINYGHSDDHMRFVTASSERMRIDSTGRVLIDTTSNFGTTLAKLQVNGSGIAAAVFNRSNNGVVIGFQRNGGSDVGTISLTASSTAYNTSSDYRLKENATAISDGITRLKTLKPYRFNFKVDKDTTVDGFFAHEVTAVPEAVTGTKDEVDSDNNPIYQGIDQSKLVPLLVAAVQELITKVETLEAA